MVPWWCKFPVFYIWMKPLTKPSNLHRDDPDHNIRTMVVCRSCSKNGKQYNVYYRHTRKSVRVLKLPEIYFYNIYNFIKYKITLITMMCKTFSRSAFALFKTSSKGLVDYYNLSAGLLAGLWVENRVRFQFYALPEIGASILLQCHKIYLFPRIKYFTAYCIEPNSSFAFSFYV